MGSINRGSFNFSKASGVTKMNNNAYTQKKAEEHGNNANGFRKGFRVPAQKTKIVENKKED